MNWSSERSRKTNGTETAGKSFLFADDAVPWFMSALKCTKPAEFSVLHIGM